VAREQRKLRAILATDVVGYSRLMGATRAALLRACVEPGLNGWSPSSLAAAVE
jgi:hypothetical protein